MIFPQPPSFYIALQSAVTCRERSLSFSDWKPEVCRYYDRMGQEYWYKALQYSAPVGSDRREWCRWMADRFRRMTEETVYVCGNRMAIA